MNEDMTITAEFARYYDKVTKVEGQGSIELNPDKDQYKEGEKVQVTANETASAKFSGWGGDISGEQISQEITVENTNSADRIEIKANFGRAYYINTTTQGEGKISLEPDQEKYSAGTEVTITAEALNDYGFTIWSGDEFDGAREATQTIEMTKHLNIEASFDPPINFPDSNFEEAIRGELDKSSGNIYPSDFGTVAELSLGDNEITDISPLADANLFSLEKLYFASNDTLKYKWVIDDLEEQGVYIDTDQSNVISVVEEIIDVVNNETDFNAAANKDSTNYPYEFIIKSDSTGKKYTIYVESKMGGQGHLDSQLDGTGYSCIE
jgi:hypothetical protein